MKVKCISIRKSENKYYPDIKLHEEYVVVEIIKEETKYIIIDETGRQHEYPSKLFIIVREKDLVNHKKSPSADGDQVNHPQHYGGKDNVYETIKVIEAWNCNFNIGQVVKYVSRAGKKDSLVQDLEKAKWYLEREINNLKNK